MEKALLNADKASGSSLSTSCLPNLVARKIASRAEYLITHSRRSQEVGHIFCASSIIKMKGVWVADSECSYKLED